MKKIILTIFLSAILFYAFAVDPKEYKASNGVTYHIGDTIKLGRGSANNGDFLWLQMGGWSAALSYDANKGSDQLNLGKHHSGLNVIVKKMKTMKLKGAERTYFIVGGGNITNYNLYIEDAIETCEVAICKQSNATAVLQVSTDKYDQLKKLKELYNEGTLSHEEYDAEKTKLLSQE
jgi:hypothetical protein